MKRIVVVGLLVLALFAFPISSNGEQVDQRQQGINYGFWLDDDMIRWQEFKPTVNSLTSIEIYMHRVGSPGNLIVEITTPDNELLGSVIIEEFDVPSLGWLRIYFSNYIVLIPGTKYRIRVYADLDSTSVQNRYFWRGSTLSTYDSDCLNDVIHAWPDYDYAFITYAPEEVEVYIDIKPGSDPNSINPRSKGKIPVAILSTMDFYAPAEVDAESLTFGATGDEPSLAFCNDSPEDVNDDGEDDLVCHFNTQEAGFECGDTEGFLRGQTVDEIPIEGSDTIRIVPSACHDEKPPSVKHTKTNNGPLRSYEITCQDKESGLAEISVPESRNFGVDIPPFIAGTNDPIIVTATNENQSENSFIELEVIDVAGNVTYYDPEENPASEEQKSSGGSSSVLGCFIATAAD